MKKVVFFTNLPSPYRIEFFNDLARVVDLTVIFEARRVSGNRFNWNDDNLLFKAVYLDEVETPNYRVNWNILKYVKKNEYDEVFFTNYGYYTEMFALIKAKLIGLPYYLELDGAVYKKESAFKRLFKKFLIKGARKYFSPSELTDRVLNYYGVDNDLIIRYPFSSMRESGIRESVVSPSEKLALRSELGMTEKKIVICIGQFIHRKGIDVLLRASKDLTDDTGVYIIGGTPTPEYIKMVEDMSLPNIHFVGFQGNDTLRKYYESADLFVLPTREDVWGLVVNEAMANGLPVVTTDNCGAGLEIVKDNGRIVKVDDVSGLADAMNDLLSDPERLNRMSSESLKIIMNYTIEAMVKKHVEFLTGDAS